MKIIIAGGGIGGLVTALSLHEAGFEVKVFESVKSMKPLGVGLNLLPHSMRVLTKLGLKDKIAEWAVETRELVYANRLGQIFWSEPRGIFDGNKWEQFSVHRGKLQVLLFEEAQRVLGRENVLTNHHFSHFEQTPTSVSATFIENKTGVLQCVEKGDILIGGDGIHSNVRKQLYPNEGAVKYSGNVLYRGTTIMEPYLTAASMLMIGSNKLKMVVYPIGKVQSNGTQLVNWVGNIKEGPDYQLKERDWNRETNRERLLEKYAGWKYDWLDVPQMISGAERIYEFPMSDRDPLPKWTFGRVTLIGDAAHPMYPIGSNGASQAILDGESLTQHLLNESDVFQALLNYEAVRVPTTREIVLKNRQKGPDQMLDLIEDRFPEGFNLDEIPNKELESIMQKYKQVAGFDKESLNSKS